MSGLRFDTIVDFAGTGTTTAAAVNAMKPGGRIVLVGLSAKEVSLNTYDLVSRGASNSAWAYRQWEAYSASRGNSI